MLRKGVVCLSASFFLYGTGSANGSQAAIQRQSSAPFFIGTSGGNV